MPITKDQWKAIETELFKLNGWVVFKLGEHEITVEKTVTETKNFIVVWFDGSFKNSWGNPETVDFPAAIAKVWKKSSKPYFKESFKKAYEKVHGKRKPRKRFLDFDEMCVRYSPNFSKASVLVKQYKKIEGLELVVIGN